MSRHEQTFVVKKTARTDDVVESHSRRDEEEDDDDDENLAIPHIDSDPEDGLAQERHRNAAVSENRDVVDSKSCEIIYIY